MIGTGKDRAVRFKAPKTEKSRRDVALTSGAIEVLRSQPRAAVEVAAAPERPLL